ncbi:hypothetical protein SDC9_91409 [bioreactor metagenome]|uniref:Uncharacterized protein n=1 Tax=bioreactor metagenome TaxID=1076179 RepID=A0A644ZWD9_9ZZZZ
MFEIIHEPGRLFAGDARQRFEGRAVRHHRDQVERLARFSFDAEDALADDVAQFRREAGKRAAEGYVVQRLRYEERVALRLAKERTAECGVEAAARQELLREVGGLFRREALQIVFLQ